MSSEEVTQIASEQKETDAISEIKLPKVNKANRHYYKHREDILARRKERQMASPEYQAKLEAKKAAKEKKEDEKRQQLEIKLQKKREEKEREEEKRKIEAKERARQRAETKAKLSGIQKASGQNK